MVMNGGEGVSDINWGRDQTGAQIKNTTDGNQNEDVDGRGTGREIKGFFFLRLLALDVITSRTSCRIRPRYQR